jgi:hypothetical protein
MKKKSLIILGIFILLVLSIYLITGQDKVDEFRKTDKSKILEKYDINQDGFLDHEEKIPVHKDLNIDSDNCPYKKPDSKQQCPFKEKELTNPEGHE